jgi:hypothetical protein
MNKLIIKLLGITLIFTSLNLLTTPSQAEENKPKIRRPKASFFEQERKQKFGFADFVSSALDGADTFFAADNNVKALLASPNKNQFYNPTIPGTLTIVSRDRNSPNFLKISLEGGSLLNFNLSNAQYSKDPRIGTINVSGVPGVTTFQYTGSFSVKNDLVSGVVQLIDPKNPGQSIFIQLPATNIPNVQDKNTLISTPVFFNRGLPSDR